MFDRRITALLIAGLACSSIQGQDLSADPDRLEARIEALGEFGKNVVGGVSRVAYSDADLAGR